jgi:hypothetical protein
MIHNFVRKEEVSTPENLEILNHIWSIRSALLIVIRIKTLGAYPTDGLSIVDELVDLRLLPDLDPRVSRLHSVYPEKVVVVLVCLQTALKLQEELILSNNIDFSIVFE